MRKSYLPKLNAKLGEAKALGLVTADEIDDLLPCVVFGAGFGHTIPKQLAKNWGSNAPIAIDATALAATEAKSLFDEFMKMGVCVVPVVQANPKRLSSPEITAANAFQNGICMNIPLNPSDGVLVNLARVQHAFAGITLVPEDTDIVLDLGHLTAQIETVVSVVLRCLDRLPYADRWRNIFVGGSSFPHQPLYQLIAERGTKRLPRIEWYVFQRLLESDPKVEIGFCDETVCPINTTVPEVLRGPSANLRYSTPDEFIVSKARKKDGNQAFYSLCKTISESDDYFGPAYSLPDELLEKYALKQTPGPGQSTQWRMVDVGHHILMTLEQVQNAS
ncbi:MAG: hypothetical protein QM796_00955 [Chthoniobacteraceae bacterium]